MNELSMIARQHPQSVAFVFSQYGYPGMPASPQSLYAMSIKYGHPFLKSLAAQIAADHGEHSSFLDNILGGKKADTNLQKKTTRRDRNNAGPAPARKLTRLSGGATASQAAVNTTPKTLDIASIKAPQLQVATNVAQQPAKTPFFDKVLGLLERGAGIYSNVVNTQQMAAMQEQAKTNQEKKKNRTWLIAGIALVVLMLVALLVLSNKKTIK